ncbi:ROK family protein [Henriciella litoralis]|uniref:ROK family protein n=1 Tax=Henriciella litoralis TaxID=568102 RepID=UPI000A02257F|nr:ROK family protein [Henriciella litoralis]
MEQLKGGIDAGGTTFKCGVADASGTIIARRRIPVTSPDVTIAACSDFFGPYALESLGIASFGPIDVDRQSPDYGMIQSTPKAGWSGVNLREAFHASLGLMPVIETDVNGALLAEMHRGAAKGLTSAAYVTVGTGIGAGFWGNGGFLGQPHHPEFGHIGVPRHPADADFKSVCLFHADCLEGLASATAMRMRAGAPETLAESDPAWDIEAYYLAAACRAIFLNLRPQRIILGGGLMLAAHLPDKIHSAFDVQMGGYLGQTRATARQLIVTPGLGDDAGLVGAILLGGGQGPA